MILESPSCYCLPPGQQTPSNELHCPYSQGEGTQTKFSLRQRLQHTDHWQPNLCATDRAKQTIHRPSSICWDCHFDAFVCASLFLVHLKCVYRKKWWPSVKTSASWASELVAILILHFMFQLFKYLSLGKISICVLASFPTQVSEIPQEESPQHKETPQDERSILDCSQATIFNCEESCGWTKRSRRALWPSLSI